MQEIHLIDGSQKVLDHIVITLVVLAGKIRVNSSKMHIIFRNRSFDTNTVSGFSGGGPYCCHGHPGTILVPVRSENGRHHIVMRHTITNNVEGSQFFGQEAFQFNLTNEEEFSTFEEAELRALAGAPGVPQGASIGNAVSHWTGETTNSGGTFSCPVVDRVPQPGAMGKWWHEDHVTNPFCDSESDDESNVPVKKVKFSEDPDDFSIVSAITHDKGKAMCLSCPKDGGQCAECMAWEHRKL